MAAQNLFLDLKPKTPAATRTFRMRWTEYLRHAVQLGFTAFIVYTSVAHGTAETDATTASIDALCPFGGLETVWRWIVTGGQFVSKTHLSNLVLGLGLLIGVLVAGGAFCGWVCPFSALQDLMSWIRRKLRLKEILVPEKKGCTVCEKPCPVKLPVATANTISANCIGCLACVEACPRQGALEVQLAPTWFDGMRNLLNRNRMIQNS